MMELGEKRERDVACELDRLVSTTCYAGHGSSFDGEWWNKGYCVLNDLLVFADMREECFHENLHREDKMTVSYLVTPIDNGAGEVDFWVREILDCTWTEL